MSRLTRTLAAAALAVAIGGAAHAQAPQSDTPPAAAPAQPRAAPPAAAPARETTAPRPATPTARSTRSTTNTPPTPPSADDNTARRAAQAAQQAERLKIREAERRAALDRRLAERQLRRNVRKAKLDDCRNRGRAQRLRGPAYYDFVRACAGS